MKKQFQLILLAAITLLSLVSCVKNTGGLTGNGPYYIKFKSDGVQIKYDFLPPETFNETTSNGDYVTMIGGQKLQSESDKNMAILTISDPQKVTTNITYTNYQTAAGAHKRTELCIISLFDNTGKFFASWGDEFANTGIISDTKIKFTEITSSYVKGTFSGTVYKDISGTAENRMITEGEFYAPL